MTAKTRTTPDYLDMPLSRFLELVASGDSAPGGGAAAAVAVALSAGLSSMSAILSSDHLPDAAWLISRTERLRQEVARLAQADAEAYRRVIAARHAQDQSVQAALSGAADVPMAIVEVGAETADIAARLVTEDGNPNLKGDAMAAVLLAEAGVRAATALVKINLSAAGIEDGRLNRADELADTAAAARQAVEGVG
ncbi:MAG: cyclodeaminase/cyclohydrolase family protein [Actinomycetota bacterium]|jgi:formiminotetrahydrofolate cyclodeaminase|nr:cyclodeaminase/cyclohydrolase family protein [Actinomycetota bacterium]MDQ5828646.1 cyclodeaminase/cyclohydrolase family protein [Actinomycetota bacterium]